MAFVNTSLTFSAENQSLWTSGPVLNFYIDTGDYLVYDPGEQVKHFSFDAGIFDVSFDAYIDVRFGLVAWANLGTAGVWDATYELDLTVGLPGASYGDRDMLFDFSRYEVVSAEISSLGFGAGEKGIGAGLDLIIFVQAGARDITLETWIKDFNFGGFSLIDIDEEINLISVTLAHPEFTLDLFDGVELTARLPQGADTEGGSQGSGYVEGHGVSDVRFLELSADLDELLTGLLQKLPGPAAAVGKVLAETVFAEHSFDLGHEISLVPNGAVTFEFTMVDIGAGVGLVITEDVALDITVPGASEVPDINITLTSDNGTPGDTSDDRYAYGKLGDVLTLRSPATPLTGTALITADFSIARAHFSHEVGLGVNASITIDILQGSLDGSWVPGFLKFSFGPLLELELPEDGWNAELGTLFADDFEIKGSAFNSEQDVYSVFYVQESVAFTGWDPELPGAEEAIYGYFEASYQQLEAALLEFDTTGFNTEPDALPTEVVLDYRSPTTYPTKVFFNWIASQDNVVSIDANNGSVVMVAPGPPVPGTQTGAIVHDNLRVAIEDGAYLSYASHWTSFYAATYGATNADFITHEYNEKTIRTFEKTNVAGREKGDVLLYFKGGDYFDGRGNNGVVGDVVGQWDVFVADLRAYNANMPVYWDLAKSVGLENDGDAHTMGGITLGAPGNTITVKNVEAAALFTGGGDDYLVGAVQSDVFVTGGGDDIVKLVYQVLGANGGGSTQQVDIVDDYVRLDSGDDTAIVELGNIPTASGAGTDYVFGGSGVDNVFIRSGGQGLRYDIKYQSGAASQDYLFGGAGLGADASHAQLSSLVALYARDIESNHGGAADGNFYSPSQYLLMNGGPQQGRIEIATDVEFVSILPGGYGVGDDLLVFMGGTRYDGGSDGDDTFAADFTAWEWLLGSRGGLQLRLDHPVSYFGETIIENIDRLHVTGTSDADVIYGGLLDDHIDGSYGNDFISGGIDSADDVLSGGYGDDTFLWVNSGNDSVHGGAGSDTIFVRHHVEDDHESGGASGNTYDFFDAAGTRLISTGELSLLGLAASAHSQRMGFLDTVLIDSIEHVNVRGSNSASDTLIYQGGNYYIGGENLTGLDADVFMADFSGQGAGIDFRITDNYNVGNAAGDAGYWLGNDVFIQGIDRGVIQGGEGLDIMIGGRFGDYFLGGGGDDVLYGGIDNSPDTLEGGEGSDTFYWYSDPVATNKRGGSDSFVGGTNGDGSFEDDRLILGGGQGPSRVKILEFDLAQDQWVEILPYDASLLKGFAWAFRDDVPENTHGSDPRYAVPSARSTLQMLAENSLRSDLRWEYYTSDISDTVQDPNNSNIAYQWRNPSKQAQGGIDYAQMESVDIVGSDAFDDIVVYQHGAGYAGGERLDDGDLFVADLREFAQSLRLDVNFEPGLGYDIGQGTRIADFERLHVLLGSGDDTVEGGYLDDTAYAGDGNDQMSGGLGNDHFHGEGGNDFFEHNGGNDVFDGGLGNDVLLVGASADPFEVAFFDVADQQIGPRYSMVSGTLGISDFSALYGTTGDDYITVYHGDDELQFRSMEEVQMAGSEQNDVLVGGTAQGILFGGGGNDALIGRGGNDFMSGGAGSDIYVFGANFGNDVIFGESFGSSRLVFAGNTEAQLSFALAGGVNLLVSQASNSVLVLDYFVSNTSVGLNFIFETTDSVFTKDFTSLGAVSPGAPATGATILGTDMAEDIKNGTANVDTIRAFGGDDFILATAGGDLIDGGTGSDAVSYFNSNAAVAINLLTFSGAGGYAKGDLLVSIEHIAGSKFSDTVTGNNFGNVINGSEGADTLFGLDGDDLLSGDDGADSLDGGAGNDRVYGGIGNDTLSGGLGTDYLSGGAGADAMMGGDGADILEGGLGNDTAHGGQGEDIFIYAGGVNTWDGGTESDSADFDRFGSAIQVDLTAVDKVLTRDGPDVAPGGAPLRVVTHITAIENIRATVHADTLRGDVFANRLEGGLGNDRLTGGAGIDTLIGGGGTDTVDYSLESGSAGLSVSLLVPGNEYGYDSHGDRDMLSGIENVVGTPFADYMQGSGGDNLFVGGGGNDSLHGQHGDDTIFGDAGEDTIDGGDGNDLLVGGADADTVDGQNGHDTLEGGSGDDFLQGRSGNDVIFGNDGNDELIGGTGNDILVGGADNDTAYGDSGDDLFIAGTDGGGNDTYDGDGDFDTVSYTGTSAGITVTLSNRQVVGPEIGTDTLFEIENVVGGTGNDSMTGNDDDNSFSYFGGLDTYNGANGSDTVNYAEFHSAVLIDLTATDEGRTRDMPDLLSGSLRTITQLTSMENIVGTDFADDLTGNQLRNIISGGKGNDRITGGLGNDTVSGDDGNDVFVNEPGHGSDSFVGGAGIDTLDYSAYGDYVDASLVDGDGDDQLFSVERLVGSIFDDGLTGSAGADIIHGGLGDDLIQAGDGDDWIVYTGGYEYIYGEAGNDTVDYSLFGFAISLDFNQFGFDATAGMSREAVFTGDTASWNVGTQRAIGLIYDNDVENAIGTGFDDKLVGDASTNMFNGGLGNDLILGMGGDDNFAYSGGLDNWDGGDGVDTANYSSYPFAVQVDLGAGSPQAHTRFGNTVASGAALTKITDLANMETIVGTNFADLLIGNGLVNRILGGAGNDTLNGGAGADQMDGGDGDDTYTVDNINDVVWDSAGMDTVFSSANFTLGSGIETLILTGNADLGGTGNKLDNTMTGNAGANLLMGGVGNDTLDGGLGADTMDGGNGDDTFTVDDLGDVIVDSGGVDTVRSSLSHVLGTSVEHLALTGGAALSGTGNDLANRLTGNPASNLLAGGLGNDTIDGGAGFDTAVFGGPRSAYVVVRGLVSTMVSGMEGVDLLTAIEKLQFDDGMVLLKGAVNDFDGDGRSDIVFRNTTTGGNVIWKSGNSATAQGVATEPNQAWKMAGVGDFNADGKADILWRHAVTGQNYLYNAGGAAPGAFLATVSDLNWKIVGIGDFDGDGKSDILWRNSSTGANTIWKSGNSATQQAVATETSQAWQVAGIGDFQSDGKADILWRNASTGQNYLYNAGNVATGAAVTTQAMAWEMAGIGDFDGDGKDDILWRNTSTGANTIWKSGNSATVQAVATEANQSWQVAQVGDFNGDAKADILWHNSVTGQNYLYHSGNAATGTALSSVVSLDWKIQPQVAAATPPAPGARVASDFDGDGKSDILFRNTTTGGNVIWKSGNSATAQGVATEPNQAWKMAGVGDFNGDAKADILWRHSVSGQNYLYQSGNAATGAALTALAIEWKMAGIGDFDADGKSDILWRNTSTGANAIWKSGNSATQQAVATETSQAWQVAGIGDFQGDGKADILWRNASTGQNYLYNAGNVATGAAVTTQAMAWEMAGIGDFDGDGKDDILWRNTSTGANTIWKSGNSATVQAVATEANQSWQVAQVGDFNGDAKADILWHNSVTGQNYLYHSGNAATGTMLSSVVSLDWKIQPQGAAATPPAPSTRAASDFDGDGKSDMLWRNSATGDNTIWNSGNMATQQTVAREANQAWQVAVVGDINGDGKADIVWRNHGNGETYVYYSGNVATGGFLGRVADLNWKPVGIGDFDGDGKGDILWRNTGTGANTIWKAGNGATLQSVATESNQAWQVAGVGDFNGDGKADILWRHATTGQNYLFNSGNAATGGFLGTVSDLNWKVVGIGDFDADGKSDILWRNTSTGDNTIWKSGNSATQQTVAKVADQAWQVVQVGDFQGDGKADIIWHNFSNGQNYIYNSGNAATGGFLGQVPDLNWQVVDGLETGDLLHGGAGNNTLVGTVNADVLFGGAGNDTMTGGRGADLFRYTSPTQGIDSITDFMPGVDKIQVLGSAFGALAIGTLAAGKLVSGPSPVANQASAQFLYNTSTGMLAFDADGTGGAAALAIVALVGQPALAAADLLVAA